MDILHRSQDTIEIFFRSEKLQACFVRNFNIDTESVCVKSGFAYEFLAGTGNAFHVDIAVEMVDFAEVFDCFYQPFHRVVGIADNTGTQEQPFNVVPPVKFDGKLNEFCNRECSPRDVIAPAIDAIGAIVYAIIGEHDFEQGNTSSVFCKTVTNPPACRTSYSAFPVGA